MKYQAAQQKLNECKKKKGKTFFKINLGDQVKKNMF